MAASRYDEAKQALRARPRRWLVTGVAGFIGSNLLETLLELGQHVVGLDNLSTGHRHNLHDVRSRLPAEAWQRYRNIEGDIRDLVLCRYACQNVDIVLHHAAMGSVPRSIAEPLAAHDVNVSGFMKMLVAARDAGVQRFIYASSSAIYGDHAAMPKGEDAIGRPLSPYAVTKHANELYAEVFARCYGLRVVGLRYFNVFGPRQDPQGAYAAVIPKWIDQLIRGERVHIHGDGESSRDFCYVKNVVQANLLAATTQDARALDRVYNVAVGERTTLNELFLMEREVLARCYAHVAGAEPVHGDFRPGDVRHSQADISSARTLLGYAPTHRLREGLLEALNWYVGSLRPSDTRLAQPAAVSP